ncbi:MAG: HAD family hydrolase [Candidatus Pedobacter colombiensis]|uniref:phosphoglycolate phosphatase n=1 Tax=Candidatus Pedobacter colombiensis TaxID=3121371 RepID=A0AAJ5W9F9_9SPHI|nr:HAD family hydrolase [Pedobacter sp.]WEK21218.1 MAG: HAD family hydrolase [Pedobacter sp.]
MENILWNRLELIVFDVDGTLYDQSKLRKIMFVRLILYYILRPYRYNELFILYHFRKEREKRAGFRGKNLKDKQYQWCAQKVNEKVEVVRKVIDQWIFNEPNRYLKRCMYPGVRQFIVDLKVKGIRTAIYSDYDSVNKLENMQIKVDLEISSTDERVNSFKPCPDGLLFILSEMNITNKNNCLYIGDREGLDGSCAEYANISFLLVDKGIAAKNFYQKLSKELINVRN